MSTVRVAVRVQGRVQGVGYRFFTREAAQSFGLSGWVRNCPDGSVEAELQGEEHSVAAMVLRMRQGPRHGHVEQLSQADMPVSDPAETSFGVRF